MRGNNQAPDRLYVTSSAKEFIDKLDEVNYFGLKDITRTELFLFAMSLGVEHNIKTPLGTQSKVALILDKYVNNEPKAKAGIYASYLAIVENASDNLDVIEDRSSVYKNAEEYANTGFELLEGYFSKSKQEDIAWDLFAEIEERIEYLKNMEYFD